jgi:putative ABC transport system substrate-binding protein
MRRRDFIRGIGGSALAWPLVARAQKPLPVIGYLSLGMPEASSDILAAARKGLAETGLAEGKDFTSEFRWARHDADKLPALAVDLVERRVAVIIAFGAPVCARAARAATAEIPIVFAIGVDPVRSGLVTTLNHPGGNVTGITTMNLELGSKWVGLLHELLPSAKDFAVLVNIVNAADSARLLITGTQAGGRALGIGTEFVFASAEREIDAALDGLGARAQALIIHPDIFFLQNSAKLVALAMREKLPTLDSRFSGGRRPDELWIELLRCESPGRYLCRTHPQGRETRRSARATGDQVRFGHQSQNRQDNWRRHPSDLPRPRRRGDRMRIRCNALCRLVADEICLAAGLFRNSFDGYTLLAF